MQQNNIFWVLVQPVTFVVVDEEGQVDGQGKAEGEKKKENCQASWPGCPARVGLIPPIDLNPEDWFTFNFIPNPTKNYWTPLFLPCKVVTENLFRYHPSEFLSLLQYT